VNRPRRRGSPHAAPLPVLGAQAALRFGSACRRVAFAAGITGCRWNHWLRQPAGTGRQPPCILRLAVTVSADYRSLVRHPGTSR